MDGVFHPLKFGSSDQIPAAPRCVLSAFTSVFVWLLSRIKQDTFNDLTFKHFRSFELAQIWVDFDAVSQNLIKLKGARILLASCFSFTDRLL